MSNDHLKKKLTIAIPVYNEEKFIRSTVESCLGQAGKILIYDNCSTDNTGKVCSELASQYPDVQYIRHAENIGAFQNFKKSLFDCETEYFCWLGSHDMLGADYTMPLLSALEKNNALVLAFGTIVYVDESGSKTGKVSKENWANKSQSKPALDRAAICAIKIKDCFLYYGILRTTAARKAWFDQPSLGFDRAFLCRLATEGEFHYQPDVVFYARDLDKSRKGQDSRSSLIRILGKSATEPNARDLIIRNKSMVQTVLDQAKTDSELGRALTYIDKINRRYSSRKKYQKIRLAVAFFVLLAAFIVFQSI